MPSFNPPLRVLMGPGPSDVHPRVLAAMARPCIGHLDPAFTAMMEEGRRKRERGETLMVPRYDIVPIPPHLRNNLSTGSIMEFPFDVVESMYAFRANDVVGKISPRPLLLLHPANDSVTPTEQSIDLFMRAGPPTDLHLVAGVDHFMFSEKNPLVVSLVRHWLARYFPA